MRVKRTGRQSAPPRRPTKLALTVDILEPRTLLAGTFPIAVTIPSPGPSGLSNQPRINISDISVNPANSGTAQFASLSGNNILVGGDTDTFRVTGLWTLTASAGSSLGNSVVSIMKSGSSIPLASSSPGYSFDKTSVGGTATVSFSMFALSSLPSGSSTLRLKVVNSDHGYNSDNLNSTFYQFAVIRDSKPVGTTTSASVNQNKSLSLQLTESSGTAPFTYAIISGPSHQDSGSTFSISSSGVVSYKPSPTYSGSDSFSYVVTDTYGIASATVVVNVTVNPGAKSVVPTLNLATTPGATLTNVSILATSNPEGNALNYVQDSSLGGLTFNTAGSFSYTAPNTSNTYSFTYHANDTVENINSDTGTVSIFVVPTPVITSFDTVTSLSVSNLTNSRTITLHGTAEAGSSITIGQTGLTSATTSYTTTADTAGNWVKQVTVTADDTFSYTASSTRATTPVHNSATSTAFQVKVDSHTPNVPVISGFTPVTSLSVANLTNATAITISGTSDEKTATVTLFRDGVQVATNIVVTGSTAPFAWSTNVSGLTGNVSSAKNYVFTATQTSLANKTSAVSSNFTVSVDTHTPGQPTGLVVSPKNATTGGYDVVTTSGTVTLSGKAEANSTVALFYRLSSSQVAVGQPVNVNGSGDWSTTITSLSDGNYTFFAKATTAANTTSAVSADYLVRLDRSVLSASINSIQENPAVLSNGSTFTNLKTFTLRGTSDGKTVSISLNGGQSFIATSIPVTSGAWSYQFTTANDGTFSFTSTPVSTLGTAGAISSAFVVVVDTAAPAAPSIVSASPVTGNNIATSRNITLSGTAEKGSVVKVFYGNVNTPTLAGSTTSDLSTGNWSLPLTNLGDLVYNFFAKATDTATNQGAASSTFNVTVDLTTLAQPTLLATVGNNGSVVNGTTYTKLTTVPLSGTSAGATVSLFNGANLLASGIAVTSGTWTYNASLTPGSYQLTVRSTSSLGQQTSAASSALSLVVDTTAPSLPLITGAPGPNALVANPIVISGTAEALSTVKLFSKPSTQVGSTTADANGAWSIDVTSLNDATYTFFATSTDFATNTSQSIDDAVTIDRSPNGAPKITAIQNNTGTFANKKTYTSFSTFTLLGTSDGATVTVSIDGTPASSNTTVTDGTWSFVVSGLADGDHTITAVSNSNLGIAGSPSLPFSVVVDTTTPAVPVITTLTPNISTSGPARATTSPIILNGTVNLNGSAGEPYVFVNIFERTGPSTSTLLQTVQTDATGVWSLDLTSLPDAFHTFFAQSSTLASKSSAITSDFQTVFDRTPLAIPAITGIANNTGSHVGSLTYTSQSSFDLIGTASGSTVTVYRDGVAQSPVVSIDNTGHWSFRTGLVTPLADGTYSFTVISTSALGTVSNQSNTFNVVVDTHPPAAPVIAKLTPNIGDASLGRATTSPITLTGTAEANSSVAIYNRTSPSSLTLLTTLVADSTGGWTTDFTSLPDGIYAFVATSTDLAAQSSDPSNIFNAVIDRTVINVPTIDPIANYVGSIVDAITYTSLNQFTLTGTASGALVTLSSNGSVLSTNIPIDGTGHWSYLVGANTPLTDGSYNFSVFSTTALGTTSVTSDTLAVIVDTHKPSVPTILAISPDSGLSTTDFITNGTSITIVGRSEANSTISIRNTDTNTLFGSVVTRSDGLWQFLLGSGLPLAEGTYHISVTATDFAQVHSDASTPVTLRLITTPPPAPTVVLSQVDDHGASFIDGLTNVTLPRFTITGATSDTRLVELYRVGQADPIASLAVSSTGSVTLKDPAVLTDGTDDFYAVLTDIAGNRSQNSATFRVVIDTQAPTLTAFSSITPNPRNTAVSSLDLTFSKPIDLSAFPMNAFVIKRNGQAVSLPDGLTFTRVTGNTYRLAGLEAITSNNGLALNGEYEISLNVAQVTDLAGNSGSGTDSTNFTIDTIAPTISKFGPITPSLRNTSVDTVEVLFSKPIDTATFTTSTLSLTFNGQPLSIGSGVHIESVSGSKIDFLITGLNSLTQSSGIPIEGSYILTIDQSSIRDIVGNSASGKLDLSFAIDTTLPRVILVSPTVATPTNQSIDAFDVEFSEPINLSTFSTQALRLTLNGQPVSINANALQIQLIKGSLYRISGLSTSTRAIVDSDSNYVLTVDPSTVADFAGNFGNSSLAGASSFQIDTARPFVQSFSTDGVTSPRRDFVPDITIKFSKPVQVSTVTIDDVSLSRDGLPIPLTPGQIVPLSQGFSDQFRIVGLKDLSKLQGVYELTVHSQFVDRLGNLGKDLPNTTSHPKSKTLAAAFDFVIDHTAPTLQGLQDITVRATGPGGISVKYPNIFASDSVDLLNDSVIFSKPGGTVFPVGKTVVTVTSTDRAGNTATSAFQVTVLPQDSIPPKVNSVAFGVNGRKITQVVVTFSEAMTADLAKLVGNYQLALVKTVRVGRGSTVRLQSLTISRVSYNESTHSATLSLLNPVPRGQVLQLVVFGKNLTDISGNYFAGNPSGKPQTDYLTTLGPQTPVVATPRVLSVIVPRSLKSVVRPSK